MSPYLSHIDAVKKAAREAARRDGLAALRSTTAVSREIELAQRELVAELRREHTWSEIADALGVRRQAAQQRFGPRDDRTTSHP